MRLFLLKKKKKNSVAFNNALADNVQLSAPPWNPRELAKLGGVEF